MDTILNVVAPVLDATTIVAFLALMLAGTYLFLQKTKAGASFKSKTAWMGWTVEAEEDPYNGFRIHPSNYTKRV